MPYKKWLSNVRSYTAFRLDTAIDRSPVTLADQNGMMGSMMQDLAFAIPGVDEAMGFAEIMKCVHHHLTTPIVCSGPITTLTLY